MTSSGIAEQPAMSVEATAAARDFLVGEKLEDGIGLCLSGGGFRAMLFHVGAFIRLNELGQLARLDRVASVSGGSIAAGALAVAWNDLRFDAGGIATNLKELVAVPLLDLARKRVDKPAILLGMLPFVSAARVASIIYDQTLFHGKTLQDLPDRPRFSFTATSLQSGVLWRFARDYAADWRVGLWAKPELPIAMAVGASAAFHPISRRRTSMSRPARSSRNGAPISAASRSPGGSASPTAVSTTTSGWSRSGKGTRRFSSATAARSHRLPPHHGHPGCRRRSARPTLPCSKAST
jgi:hypothetical protein